MLRPIFYGESRCFPAAFNFSICVSCKAQNSSQRDTQHLLLPATETEILAALDHLRIAPLLDGYRGAPGCDRASVLRAVMAVQDYVIAQEGRVAEVEVNPLIVTPTRAVVADALIRGDL